MMRLEEECFGLERFSQNVLQAFIIRDDAFALLADEANEILGMALCLFSRDRREGRVASVSVREDHRRRGVGSALLAEAEAELERCGANTFGLEVGVANQPAIGLYLTHGYTVTAVMRDYYGPARHAYVMEKALPSREGKVRVQVS